MYIYDVYIFPKTEVFKHEINLTYLSENFKSGKPNESRLLTLLRMFLLLYALKDVEKKKTLTGIFQSNHFPNCLIKYCLITLRRILP